MVDITEISAIVAAAGVLIGVALTVLELRHLSKQRQTDFIERIYSVFIRDDFLEALLKIGNLEYADYKDFVKKYGPISSDTPLNVALMKVCNFYDEVGTFVHEGLVDADMLSHFAQPSIIYLWNKLKPLIEGVRKEMGAPYFRWFEYLYNEMKKREQKLKTS